MNKTIRKIALSFGLSIATIASTHAGIATPLVELQEKAINDANGNWLMNQYVVTNNSPTKDDHIFAFGVTNPLAMETWTTREDWTSITLSKDDWNNGSGFKAFCTSEGCSVWNTGEAKSQEQIYLGSFESLFGSEDNYVNFYYLIDAASAFTIGESDDRFYFSAPPASEYAVFAQGGRVTYQSFNVPEPDSALLISLALLGLVGVHRRRID